MAIIKAIRIDQWVKNILIFVPIFTSGSIGFELFQVSFIVFIGFSFVVSSTYILNDLVDIKADRLHPKKNKRPIANNIYHKNFWFILSFVLFFFGNYIIFLINKNLLIFNFIYCLITLFYSLKLKYIVFFDILSIVSLFILRVLLGGASANIEISIELLLFVALSSLGIVSGKKVSIMKNELLLNTKIRVFLYKNYSSKFLTFTTKYSLLLSSAIYLYWIINENSFDLIFYKMLYLILSFLSLLSFNYYFIKETRRGETEEILNTLLKNPKLFLSISLFLLFSVLGI